VIRPTSQVLAGNWSLWTAHPRPAEIPVSGERSRVWGLQVAELKVTGPRLVLLPQGLPLETHALCPRRLQSGVRGFLPLASACPGSEMLAKRPGWPM
jgi:hypothetical protein